MPGLKRLQKGKTYQYKETPKKRKAADLRKENSQKDEIVKNLADETGNVNYDELGLTSRVNAEIGARKEEDVTQKTVEEGRKVDHNYLKEIMETYDRKIVKNVHMSKNILHLYMRWMVAFGDDYLEMANHYLNVQNWTPAQIKRQCTKIENNQYQFNIYKQYKAKVEVESTVSSKPVELLAFDLNFDKS